MRGPDTPDPVERVRDVLHEPDPRAGRGRSHRAPKAPDTDVTESFRRARSSVADITTDLQHLRRRATSVVKGTQRPAKSK